MTFLLLLAAQHSALTGTPTVTLEELMESADRLNIEQRISVEQHERAEAELRAAWTSLLPGLTVQGGWTHNQFEIMIPNFSNPEEMVTFQAKNQLDVVGRIDVPLIDTTRWMQTSAAAASADGAEERVRLSSDQVKRAVATGWYTYAASLALRASAERSIALAEAQLKLQEARMRAESATELDLLRARAEVQRNRQSVADAVRFIAIARRSLETLTGRDPGGAARLPPIDLAPPAPLAELEAGVERLPLVRAAAHDLRALEKVATASQLALIPNLNGFFMERASNAASFSGEAATYTLGVTLLWRLDAPTFMRMDVQSSNVGIAELLLERARLSARDQINVDWQTLTGALAKVTAAQSQLEASQRARAVASTRYQVGASTQLEVIQADRDLFSAEVQQIQAQSELASSRVALQISAGLPVEVR